MAEITDEIRRYYEHKTRCPRCNSKNLVDTNITILDLPKGQYKDKKNITMCNECQWRGVVDDLKG